MMAAGEPPARRGAAAAPGLESAAEAVHLLALAESELAAGRVPAARRHALRASRLYPSSGTRASVVVTAANVLLSDASSHYAALLLPDPDDPDASPLSASGLRRHFKSLVKSLRVGPDYAADYPSSAAAAQEALRRATEAHDALLTAPPPTFWTACAGCRLLHEFDRKYVGCRLACPSCRRTFRAVEVPSPQEAEAENSHSDLMAVEHSDFYDFDADRGEGCLRRGQVWALYADADCMPRHYALVAEVRRGTKFRAFRAQIRWLDGEEEGKPCGQFKVGREETVDSVNVFSHLVVCVTVAKEVYQVYPRKGSVWALHAGEERNAGRTKYGIVVMLGGYVERYGASFGYLEKVEGFRSIFTLRDVGSHGVHFLQKDDLGALSHQIPAWKLRKDVGSALPPGDCWELDPAALPPELLRMEIE